MSTNTTNAARLPADRRGFTLTELLVVIAIIAVLAALVSVGVMRAVDSARQTAIKSELDNLDAALRAYKDKYGEFPPCDLRRTNQAAIRRHVIRAFPRYYNTANIWDDIRQVVHPSTMAMQPGPFRPDMALVFWLGGFNPDPTRPFTNLNGLTKAQRKDVLFDFDTTRLINLSTNGDQFPSYVPPGVKNNAPYVYLDASYYQSENLFNFMMNPFQTKPNNADTDVLDTSTTSVTNGGFVAPYFHDLNGNNARDAATEDWVNPDSFQLISSGTDGKFGSTVLQNSRIRTTLRCYPTGAPADPTQTQPFGYDALGADDDNVVNFLNKSRLGDAKP